VGQIEVKTMGHLALCLGQLTLKKSDESGFLKALFPSSCEKNSKDSIGIQPSLKV
jgi:hypothetical protein